MRCGIDLRILRLIRELKHSNSNMRHQRLNSKGSLFLGTPCTIAVMRTFLKAILLTTKPRFYIRELRIASILRLGDEDIRENPQKCQAQIHNKVRFDLSFNWMQR